MIWVATGSVLLAAVVVGWPGSVSRARRRRVLAPGAVVDRPAVGTGRRRPVRRLWWPSGPRWLTSGLPTGLTAGPPTELTAGLPAGLPTGLLAGAGAIVAAIVAAVAGGPVAAVVVGAYASVAALGWHRRRLRRARATHRARLLDLLNGAAADLRAGLPVGSALTDLEDAGGDDPLWARVRAALRLAERTGAPLAAVIERVEADARSADRAAAAAGAQVAGARATAVMLAALPLAGLGLGYAIGADPLTVLLRTPVGAAAAIVAVMLQLAGLGWAARITRPAAVLR